MSNLKRYAITYEKYNSAYFGSGVCGNYKSEHTEVIMALDEEDAKRIAQNTFGMNNIIRIRED